MVTGVHDVGAAAEAGGRHRLQSAGPAAVVVVLVIVLWVLVVVFSSVQQQRLEGEAKRQLRLLNNAVLLHTQGVLQDVEADLQMLDQWISSKPNEDPRQDKALAELMLRIEQGSGGRISLGFASSAGVPLAMPGAMLWQTEMPAVVLPELGRTALGKPSRQGLDQPWQWPVSRRLSKPVGQFAVAVAWIDLAALGAQHENLRDTYSDAITLAMTDGTLIARTPWADQLVGQDLRKAEAFKLTAASSPKGVYVDDDASLKRTVSYERLANYPLTVLASRTTDDAITTFHTRRNLLYGSLVVITVFSFAFAAMLTRSLRATRRSQAEFSALSAAFPLGLFRTDTTGEVIYANDAYLRQFGLPRELMGWGWSTLLDKDRQARTLEAWRRTASEGLPTATVLHFRHPHGHQMLLSVRTAPLHVDGKLVGQVGSVEDITQRMQQQKAERMLNAIFDKSTDVVVRLDPHGRLTYLNPAGRKRLGLATDTPLDRLHFKDFTPPHRVLQVHGEMMPTAMMNGIWVGETSVLDHEGREIAMSEMLIVHRDNDDRVEAFSIVMRDITRDQQARAAMQRSDSILSIVGATLPAIVAVLDDQQRYLFTNDAFNRWIGRPAGEVLGLTVKEVLGDKDYEVKHPRIEAALAGERITFEVERLADGNPQVLETTYIPFHDNEGRVSGFVALAQDITAHRMQQRKLLDASLTDALTGVLNRAGFDLRITSALAQVKLERRPLALLCIDLDGFKAVNDDHGHAAGDSVLQSVARRLQQGLRPTDTLARLGGDEFAVILSDIQNIHSAQTVAHKLVTELGKPFEFDGIAVDIGASIGVAMTTLGRESRESLLRRADAALYQAKRAGRSRFEVSEEVP